MIKNSRIMHKILILVLIKISTCHSLRILYLDVPTVSVVGETVELTCSYDLEEEKLYSVKWYKDNVEFFRYVPRNMPQIKALPIKGIKVDTSRSNKRSVFLKNLDLYSEGRYRCEVSGEEPNFKTIEMEKGMRMYLLPSEGPQISSSQPRLRPGELVTVNCTSRKSKPRTELEWSVNDQVVDAKDGNEYELVNKGTKDSLGVEVTSLSMRFLITKRHFAKGSLKLKCTAKVSQFFVMSKKLEEKDPDEENDRFIDNQKTSLDENMAQNGSRKISSHHQIVLFLVCLFLVFRQR